MHPNNTQFRELVRRSGLSQAVAMTLLNRGRAQPLTESTFKAWLGHPSARSCCDVSNEDLQMAFETLTNVAIQR